MMRTARNVILILIVLSATVFAQVASTEPAAKVTRSFIEQEGSSSKIMAVPNSINNSILLFYIYEKENGKYNLVSRTLEPNQIIFSKTTVVQRSPRKQRWDAVWHPVIKRYYAVCINKNTVITKRFSVAGKLLSSKNTGKDIDEQFYCAALGNDTVLITYPDSEGVVGQVLRSGGTIKSKIYRIAYNTGDNVLYPVRAVRDNSGNVAILCAEYNTDKDGIRPRLLRIDSRFNLLADKKLGSYVTKVGKASFPVGYDKTTGVIAFALNDSFTTVSDDDRIVIKAAKLPAWIEGETLHLGPPAYDNTADVYLLPYVQLLGKKSPKTKLGLIGMRLNGSVANNRIPLGEEVGNPSAFYFTMASGGARFGFVSTDANRGVYSFKRTP